MSYLLPLLLGLAHGLSDFAAGGLLGLAARRDPAGALWLLLFYNLVAFGLQPLAGLLADRSGRPRAVALAGLASTALGVVLAGLDVRVAVMLAGAGSALFHAAAGGLATTATPGRAAGPGLFAAFGVVGLALGGSLGYAGLLPAPLLAGGLLALGMLTLIPRLPQAAAIQPGARLPFVQLVLVPLLLAVALRSAVWTGLQYVHAGETNRLIAWALAAMLGKLLGGFLADRYGWRAWLTLAPAVAGLMIGFADGRLGLELGGLFLLQSATPASLAAAARALPGRPALAASLVLGAALLLGGLPSIFGLAEWMVLPWVTILLSLGAMTGYRFALSGPVAVHESRD